MKTITMCWGVSVLLAIPSGSAAAADEGCSDKTSAGTVCTCDVRELRPLQGAIGLDEVESKAAKIEDKPKKAMRALAADPIKVVHGPGGALFITDHHHGADAWRLAGHPNALCEIVARPAFESEADFWQGLTQDRLVRLADENGKPLQPSQLPASLVQLPDDPYRSLAWRLRKAGGFCRSEMEQKEFAEFIWADWMRAQPKLPAAAVSADEKSMVKTALSLALSPAAKALPGYIGDKPTSFECAGED